MTTDNNQEVDFLKRTNGETATIKGRKCLQFLCALTVSIGALLCGCATSWGPSTEDYTRSVNFEHLTVNTYLTILTTLPNNTKELISNLNKWLSLWFTIGGIVGALVAGNIADRHGRRMTLIGFAVPWILSWLTLAITENRHVLYGARFVCGVVTGIYNAVIPMYLTEIAEDSVRGTIGTMFQLFLILGTAFAAYPFDFITQGYVFAALSATCFILFFLILESPLYLSIKDDIAARKTLKRLRGADHNVEVELFKLHAQDVVIEKRSLVGAVILCIGLMVCRKFCGVDYLIFTVAAGIFPKAKWFSAGFDVRSSTITVVLTLTTFTSGILVRKFKCKDLLIVSGVGMAVTSTCLTFVLDGEYKRENWKGCLVIIVFILFYSIGFGPLPWILPAYLFPPRKRGLIFGIVAATSMFCDLLLLLLFSVLALDRWIVEEFYLDVLLMTFAVISADSAALMYFFLPEMMHKSNQQTKRRLLKFWE